MVRLPFIRRPAWIAAATLLGALTLAPLVVRGTGGTALKAIAALCAVGLAGAFAYRVSATARRGAPEPELRVLARSALTPRTGVAVVEFGSRRVLVGYGDGFAQVLASSHTKRPPRRKVGSP